jgi:hypothetical protein
MPPEAPVAWRAIRHARSLASLPEFTSRTSVQPVWGGGQQPFGQLDRGLLQVAAVGVERGQL